MSRRDTLNTYLNSTVSLPMSSTKHRAANDAMMDYVDAKTLALDARDFGVQAGDNDMTSNVQAAMNALISAGGGWLDFPYASDTIKIAGALQTSVNGVNPNAQLVWPLVNASDHMVFAGIRGASPPSFSSEAVSGAPRNKQGVIFESTILPGTSGGSVFGTTWANQGSTGLRNYINCQMKNCIVRTRTMTGATNVAGTMSAINMQRMLAFIAEFVKVDISSPLVDSQLPGDTSGIIWPDSGCHAIVGGNYVSAEGYRYGLTPGEHCMFGRMIAVGCTYGLALAGGGYDISIQALEVEANQYNILKYSSLGAAIFQYNTEHYIPATGIPSKWYNYTKDFKDDGGSGAVKIFNAKINNAGGATGTWSGAGNYKILFGDSATGV